MKLQEVFAYNLKSQHILNEGWDTLNESQRLYLGKAERELWPLMEQLCKVFEADLTADQIQSIFKGAETHAMDSGSNKTALGKVGDAAKLPIKLMKAVDDKINELGRAAQKTGPVQHMDKKFEDLKKKIGSKDTKIVQGVKAVSDWAKANPGKASLAVAILTAAAAFATGPGGGAAVGFLLRGTKGMLKGEKLSAVAGGAAKMAAVGAIAGALGDAMGDAEASEMLPGVDTDQATKIAANMDGEEVTAAIKPDGVDGVDADGGDAIPELPSIEEFKTDYIKAMVEKTNPNSDFSDEMIQKMANNVNIKGTYPDDIQGVNFSGNIVKGNIYLTPDEQAEFSAYLKSQPGSSMSKIMSSETNDWLSDNVEGAKGQFDAADAARAAKDAEIAADNILPADTIEAMSDSDIQARMNEIQGTTDQVTGRAVDLENPKNELAREYRQLQRELNNREMDNFSGATLDPTGLIQESAALGLGARITKQEAYKQELHKMLAEAPAAGTQTAGLEDPNTMGAKAKRGLGAAGKWAKDKVAGGVAGVKQGMKDAGNKVTANKLNKAWKKAGSPMDTGAVVNILADAGLSNDDITAIGTSTKVDLPTSTSAEPETDAGAEADPTKDPEGVKPNQGTDNKIENGTKAEYDGKEYTQQGGEWLDPNNKKATPEIEKELDAQVATPKDGETVPSDGGTAGEDEAGAEYKPKKDDIVSWTNKNNKEQIATVVEPVAPKNDKMSIVQIDGVQGTTAITTSKLQSAEDSTAPDKQAGAEADPTKADGGAEADPTKAGAEAEPEAGTDAGATPTAGTDKAVNDLANEITKAGAGEEVKAQLQSNGAGSGAAGSGAAVGEVNLPQLASDLADAGVQEIVRNQLLQK